MGIEMKPHVDGFKHHCTHNTALAGTGLKYLPVTFSPDDILEQADLTI